MILEDLECFLGKSLCENTPKFQKKAKAEAGGFSTAPIYFSGCCQGRGEISRDLQNVVYVRALFLCVCVCLSPVTDG